MLQHLLTAIASTIFAFIFVSLSGPQFREYSSLSSGQQTTGEVTGIEVNNGQCRIMYRYAVGGEDFLGDEVSVTIKNRRSAFDSGVCSRAKSLTVGSRIPVRYDATNPSHAIAYAGFPVAQAVTTLLVILYWLWMILRLTSTVNARQKKDRNPN